MDRLATTSLDNSHRCECLSRSNNSEHDRELVAYDPTQPPPRAVARLKSVKYLHAVREYVVEWLGNCVMKCSERLAELRSLNRIQGVIYAPITESSADEPSVSIAQAQVQTRHLLHMEPSWRSGTVLEPRRKTFFDFVRRDIEDLTVTTRLQAKSKTKRVRFADETSVTERRRRLTTTQDEELLWASLKIVLRGDESTLTYRAARDAWKMSDHFVLREDDVLHYVGTRLLRSDQQQEDAMLRLVVLSTMIQEVLQNCHDSLEGDHQGIAQTF
ncbi:hypothetical protein PHMEG_00033367 [Phytophthora megakarya]|uniref:Reverse transcriptase n=1 Tax=Phytophthora megakarya TaxID=4795 RepID=A0A225UT63_9STRA|nr:hypothetical protein PHMEG_00033367 [Phytophthora megakarya]